MYVSDRLVFVELQKTGSSHVVRLLKGTVAGKIVGKHNTPPRRLLNSSRKFIGSIRDPWEWYVSLWAYGCDKRGGLYDEVTRADSAIRTARDWILSPVYSASLLYSRISRSPELWRRCYADPDDPKAFRDWLRMVHDGRHWHDVGESYGRYPMSRVAGLLTYRYLKLYCRNGFKSIGSLEGLRDYEERNCYVDYFIRNEDLEGGFAAALRHAGIPLSDEQRSRVDSAGRTNASSRKHPAAFYYDDETARIVGRRERLIIDKFGYKPPSLGLP